MVAPPEAATVLAWVGRRQGIGRDPWRRMVFAAGGRFHTARSSPGNSHLRQGVIRRMP